MEDESIARDVMSLSPQTIEDLPISISPTKPKTRTTFLTLPRELCQNILHQSYASKMSVVQRVPKSTSLVLNKIFSDYNRSTYEFEKREIGKWTLKLIGACPEISDDVLYAQGKWVEDADHKRGECEDGSRYLFCKASLEIAKRCCKRGDEKNE